MARPRTVDEYLATLDKDARRTLESVRASIHKAAPAAEETISDGSPAFRLHGKLLACFRGARTHCSYHPMSGRVVAAEAKALAGFDTSKGAIRFPIGMPLPRPIVKRLVEARIAEIGVAATASPDAAIRGFIARYDPAIATQLKASRRKMRALVPRGYELVYDNYNALVFGFSPTERTSDALCSIAGYPRWVSLFLLKGARVADPDGLLEGSGSQVRGLRLRSAGDLDAPPVRALITRALAPAAATFAAAPPLRTIVKSVSARQRPRRPA
jgi:uncharacterized protein YdhG (YjbR/CyaY superfamily)